MSCGSLYGRQPYLSVVLPAVDELGTQLALVGVVAEDLHHVRIYAAPGETRENNTLARNAVVAGRQGCVRRQYLAHGC